MTLIFKVSDCGKQYDDDDTKTALRDHLYHRHDLVVDTKHLPGDFFERA